jgi:hypothetical protein
MHSLEQSFAEPRVPGGLAYMSVVTRLSTVQVVFMNRFLVEFLDYLAGETRQRRACTRWAPVGGWRLVVGAFSRPDTCCVPPPLPHAAMLAMQAKPKDLPGQQGDAASLPAPAPVPQRQLSGHRQTSVAGGSSTAAAAAAAVAAATAAAGAAPPAAAPAAAADKPLVLLLDVHLDAPVLVMPRDSSSQDHLEVDLGTLELSNRVVWEMRAEDRDRQKLLVDEMQVGGVARVRFVGRACAALEDVVAQAVSAA